MSRVRFPLLDALRCVASLAVAFRHVRGEYVLDTALGVPLFLVIMLALTARGTGDEPIGRYAAEKAARLLVPWVRWSLVYVALAVFVDTARGRGPWAGLEPRMLFYGGHGALWFLPCSFVAVLLVRSARGLVERVPALAFAAAGVLVSWAIERWRLALPLGMPWGAWLRAAPAIPWGLAVARASLAPGKRDRAVGLALLGLVAAAAATLAPDLSSAEDPLRRFALAVPLACLGFAWRPAVPRVVLALSTLTFGIYLVHPLFAKAFATAFEVARWPALLHLGAVWFSSAVAVLALRRLPVRLTECWSGSQPAPIVRMAELQRRRAA